MGLGQHLKLMLVRAERDALRAELEARSAEIEQLKAQSDEWRDVAARVVCVLQFNKIQVNGEYYAKCLNEIRAEAAYSGYVAGWSFQQKPLEPAATQYAERIKRGEE